MNVLIVTQEDPFYIPHFFKKFCEQYMQMPQKDIKVLGVVNQSSLGSKGFFDLVARMWNFYGPRDFFIQGLRYALIKLRGILWRKGLLKSASSLAYYCKSANISVLSFSTMNSQDALTFVRENQVDLIVSVSASEVFKTPILNAPKFGCINLHNAPLPYYRGMLPNFWQMLNDEPFSVLTIHTMTELLDGGEIILQKATKIEDNYSFDDLAILTKQKSATALWEVLPKFVDGTLQKKPMPDEDGSYYTFPNQSDVKQFRAKGKKLL